MIAFIFRYLLILSVVISSSSQAGQRKIYGLHERVVLPELGITVHAKLDTGAKTSSLGASDIEVFKKNGTEWVRFKPQITGKNLPKLEKMLVRHSNIKRRIDDIHKGQVLHTVRPVVLMDICIDGSLHSIEVNLADRSRFIYPLLIGSIALKKLNAIIDPSLKYQATASCT